ncbi:MAG TPA: hypothetical protein PKM63_21885 [Panacibacter sp.]|nr:hypothetical protein [Panacibacter sp.]
MWEKINRMSVQAVVAVIAIIASFGLVFALLFKTVPDGNKDLFNAMIGYVVGSTVTAIVGWLYTTSKQKPN